MNGVVPVLHYARQNSPFYARTGISGSQLEEFPVINRLILQSCIDEILTVKGDAKNNLLKCIDAPANSDARKRSEFRYSSDIVIEQTSGSSGTPLRLPKTNIERTRLGLFAWQCRAHYDASINHKTFLPLFHRSLDSPLPIDPFDASTAGVMKFYKWLDKNMIRWIHAPSGLIDYHASMLRSMGCTRPARFLQFVETSGSRPDDTLPTLVQEVLGATLINQYGTRESWAIGYAQGLGSFDLNDAAVHVELIDESNNRIEEDEREGDVILTSTVLRLLPLIRYRTGDRGYWTTLHQPSEEAPRRRKLVLAPERDINMVFHNGKWVSGNILFKDVLHKIDHKIGYGYAQFIQIRKISEFKVKVLVCKCTQTADILRELKEFYAAVDRRVEVELENISEDNSRYLTERKPYLFVNEYDSPKRGH
jgi:phenylacetate-CoA ligase